MFTLEMREIANAMKDFSKEISGNFVWFLKEWWLTLVMMNIIILLVVFLYVKFGSKLLALFAKKVRSEEPNKTNVAPNQPNPKTGNPKNLDNLVKRIWTKAKSFLTYMVIGMLIFAFLGFFVATQFYFGLKAFLVLTSVILYLVIFFIAAIFIIRGLAERKLGWTTVTSGTIAFAIAGESLVRTIPNVPGKILEPDNDDNLDIPRHQRMLIDGNSEVKKKWLEKEYGIYWLGLGPFRRIKRFTITKERENPHITAKTTSDKWISVPEPFETDELRWSFPRPVLAPDVEFKGGFKANIMVLSHFEISVPWKPLFKLHGQFFPIISSHVRSGIISYCQTMTFEDFVSVKKSDADSMSDEILKIIKDRLLEETGICISGLSVSTYEASDKETQEFLEAREKARMKGDAKIEDAKKQQETDLILAKTFKQVEEIKATAANVDIITSVLALIKQGVSPDVAAMVAGGVKQAQSYTGRDSKLTVLVNGNSGGANLALPTIPHPPNKNIKPTEEEDE